MKATPKLSAEERRAAIIKAVRGLFAEKGFHGTTTRELAAAAGVSEALLFRHFPNKASLFAAMQVACCAEEDVSFLDRLHSLEPSASTLVLLVHFLVSRIVGQIAARDDRVIQNRLILRSLAEDGEFARLLFEKFVSAGWVPKVEECVRAAVAAGDAVAGPSPHLAAWLTHHLAAAVLFHQLPDEPVVDYGVSREQLVEQAVRYCLRGIGLTDEAIRQHYNPKALALFGG
jgi:AcrR family transcriptional regulator